jgi:serine protease Do
MSRWPAWCAGLIVGCLAGALLRQPFLDGEAPSAPATAPRAVGSYRDVVKKVLPAVVSIEPLTSKPKKGAPRVDEPLVAPDDKTPLPDGSTRIGFGSGFLFRSRGVVVTNNHVVEGADEVIVKLRDGRRFTSKGFKSDTKTDLAVIRLDTSEALPALEFGDSDLMEIGDPVLAVGAPFGLLGTVTHGIVSAKDRSLKMNLYEDFLQTDAAINPGNSGGPLVNLDGRVIGITSAIKSKTGGFQGVGLAISSNLARTVIDALLRDGVVHRGYLGVETRDLGEVESGRLGLGTSRGVVLAKVFADSPAGRAGLKAGDALVGLAGKAIHEGRQLHALVAALPLGKSIEVEVLRAGKRMRLPVTVQEQPSGPEVTPPKTSEPPVAPETGTRIDAVGIVVADPTAAALSNFGYKPGARGVIVTSVVRDGLAAGAGLRPGFLITAVDRHPVTSVKEVAEAFRGASLQKGVLVRVEDSGRRARQLFLQTD